jgi:prevent-host-death family protein
MKHIQVSEDIVSLSDFKNHASKMLRQAQNSRRPIIITQNGKPAGVLISPAEFDFLSEQSRFINAVKSGLTDIEQGHVLTDEELDRALDETAMVWDRQEWPDFNPKFHRDGWRDGSKKMDWPSQDKSTKYCPSTFCRTKSAGNIPWWYSRGYREKLSDRLPSPLWQDIDPNRVRITSPFPCSENLFTLKVIFDQVSCFQPFQDTQE